MDLAHLRLSYTKGGLTEEEASADPLAQFAVWFEQAKRAGSPEPNAMALATVSASGVPNARMVLLKGARPDGFVFFTNYDSRKGQELAANSRASLLFYWPELERQVRISGMVEKVAFAESEAYFQSRPLGHQLGAWASRQSAEVPNREALEKNLDAVEERFRAAGEVPLPPFWGGFRVRPTIIEFWQGRTNRLHDRLEYSLTERGWIRRRLSP